MRSQEVLDVADALLPDEFDASMTPLQEILKETLATPGKGLRGELLRLCAGGPQITADHSEVNTLAMGIEVLHLATLVHDDLIDRGEQRRGRPSVWKKWGKKTAVLVGDYLFATAYRMINSVCGKQSMERVNFLLREMVVGELTEETEKFRLVSVDRYLSRIEKKTARFFQVAAELGCSFAALPQAVRLALGEFGRELGMAYQLFDDLQDLTGGNQTGGKPIFQDLKNGVLTLPLLLISNQPGFLELLAEVQAEGKVQPKHRKLVRKWVTASQVTGEVERLIEKHRRRAKERLAGLNLPQLALLHAYADRLLECDDKLKKTCDV